jgi:hypothetical protein
MLSRNLIAAAGNAGGGGLSYWVTRVQTSSSYTPALRSVVNTTNENIVITNTNQLSTRYFVELDYDGGLVSSSEFTMAGKNEESTLLAIDGNNYNWVPENSSAIRVVNLDDTSATILDGNQFTTYNTIGVAAYDAPSYTADFDQETANDWIVFVRGGSTAVYFTGYGEYYQPSVGVAKYSVQADNVTDQRYITYGFVPSYLFSRDVQVARGSSQKYALFWRDPTDDRTKFATYTTAGGSTPLTNLVSYTYNANALNKGVFIDPDDIMSAVQGVSTQTWIWRASVAGTYEPTKRYVFAHTIATFGYLSCSTMDADGNIYLYFEDGYLIKFSSSNTIEWCLRIDNTLVGNISASANLNEIKVQSIDDTEFLLMSLVFPVESGSNFCWYIIKAPLDLNNYLGTYGNIQISNYSFSPTVTENNHTRGTSGGSVNFDFVTQSTQNASNASASVSVTTTDI